ncbi:MAG: CHAT domain-containing protein [Gammaproteobacteria bacterium]
MDREHRQNLRRATLAVHVTRGLDVSDDDAREVWRALYTLLTRPLASVAHDQSPTNRVTSHHTESRSGLPVFWAPDPETLNVSLADKNVVVVVDPDHRNPFAASLVARWTDRTNAPAICRVAPGTDGQRNVSIGPALDAIVSVLSTTDRRPDLCLSMAEGGHVATQMAVEIKEEMASIGHPMFERVLCNPQDVHERERNNSVIVLLRDDAYSADDRCLRDLLEAKTRDIPVLDVVALATGKLRGSSALGNLNSVVWNGDAARVIARATCEWIRACVFADEARRIIQLAHLPTCAVLARPPELQDTTRRHGDLAAPDVIFHPDPELTVRERELLTAANRRLQFLTPTTAYRFLRRSQEPTADSMSRSRRTPLAGHRIGFSLSVPRDQALSPGMTKHHCNDAIAYVARCLISAGAALAYGGDLRKNGFTRMLGDLVRAYGRRASVEPDTLHSYLDAHIDPDDLPAVTFHSMRDMNDGPGNALLSRDQAQACPVFASSDTRRVMSQALSASVLIGGKDCPRTAKRSGYSGLFPGLLEEAWRMLVKGQPVYVVGGFGGASALVAALIRGDNIPVALTESHWPQSGAHFSKLRDAYWHRALVLPESMDDMAARVSERAAQFMADDSTAMDWNGLTRVENLELLSSTDPAFIAGLILKGLTHRANSRAKAKGKLELELVRGDVTSVEAVDLLSLAAVPGWPLTGAAKRVDELVGGRLERAVQAGENLVSVNANELPTDWVHVAHLSIIPSTGKPRFDIRPGVEQLVSRVQLSGFEKIALVLYGGALMSDIELLVDTMIGALRPLAGQATVVLYEQDTVRFDQIRERIETRWSHRVSLTASAGERLHHESVASETSILVTHDEDAKLLASVVIPHGNVAIASSNKQELDADGILALSKGVVTYDATENTDDVASALFYPLHDLQDRGTKIAELLFGDKAEHICRYLCSQTIQIAHDRGAAGIPFELLRSRESAPIALGSRISRRLTVPQAMPDVLFAPSFKRTGLTSLLVVDPTDDLPSSSAECEVVHSCLSSFSTPVVLERENATCANVMEQLAKVDVVHYCGHGFFTDDKPWNCGLSLVDEDLTLEDLTSLESFPRIAVMNACEVGRMMDRERKIDKATVTSQPRALAEFFLRAGTQVFVGAHWALRDDSSFVFARQFYSEIQRGKTVSTAMLESRKSLKDSAGQQWGNYLLYGQGDIQLCPKPDPDR